MRTSNLSTRDRNYKRPLAGLAMALTALAVVPPGSWADEILQESYTFPFEQPDVMWDTTYTFAFDLPRFDTQGGTRQLLGYTVSYYSPKLDYWWYTNPNPTADHVCAEIDWQFSFAAHGTSGTPWFPLFQDPPYLGSGQGRGVGRAPFWPGQDPVHSVYPPPESPSYIENTDDPAHIAEVIGTGAIAMVAELDLSEATFGNPSDDPGFPPPPEGEWAYDPDLLVVTPEALHAQLVVTYQFTPEPGSLLLILGLGALGGLRRR